MYVSIVRLPWGSSAQVHRCCDRSRPLPTEWCDVTIPISYVFDTERFGLTCDDSFRDRNAHVVQIQALTLSSCLTRAILLLYPG